MGKRFGGGGAKMIKEALIYLFGLIPMSKPKVWFYKLLGAKIGKNVKIGYGTMLWSDDFSKMVIEDGVIIKNHSELFCEKITLKEDSIVGDYVRLRGVEFYLGFGSYLGHYMMVDATEPVIIEEEVALSYSNIYTHDLSYSWITACSLVKTAPVVVKKRAWVGPRCQINPGVTIGEHSIIGAGAVVTKDIQPFTVSVGVPAKTIKEIRGEVEETKSRSDTLDVVEHSLLNQLERYHKNNYMKGIEVNGVFVNYSIKSKPGAALIFKEKVSEKELDDIYSKLKDTYDTIIILSTGFPEKFYDKARKYSGRIGLFDIKEGKYLKVDSTIINRVKSYIRYSGVICKPI